MEGSPREFITPSKCPQGLVSVRLLGGVTIAIVIAISLKIWRLAHAQTYARRPAPQPALDDLSDVPAGLDAQVPDRIGPRVEVRQFTAELLDPGQRPRAAEVLDDRGRAPRRRRALPWIPAGHERRRQRDAGGERAVAAPGARHRRRRRHLR